MIHVFMPFLCEEMFQRIPRWGGEKQLQTIMFADMPRDCLFFNFGNTKEYDSYDQVCVDENSIYHKLRTNADIIKGCEDFELAKVFIGSARSLKAQYRIQSQKLKFFIATQADLSLQQQEAFKTLVNGASVQVIRKDEKPECCGSVVVNESFIVYCELKGLIEVPSEIAKLDKEVANIQQQMAKLQELMSSENYLRLPENLREQNVVKMKGFEEKLASCQELKVGYEALK